MLEGLFQPMHLLLILGIALLFFGPKRLPELGKGLGASIRDFRDAMSGQKPDDTDKNNSQLEAPKAAVSAAPANQSAPAQAPQASQASQSVPPQGPGGSSQA